MRDQASSRSMQLLCGRMRIGRSKREDGEKRVGSGK